MKSIKRSKLIGGTIKHGMFFKLPETDADFEYWGSFPQWTVEEAVLLSMGKDPRAVIKTKSPYNSALQSFSGDFVREHEFRLILIDRAQKVEQLPKLFGPFDFVKWVKAQNVVLHESFVRWADNIEDEPETGNNKSEHIPGKTRESLYKMILGMAIGYYYYKNPDPNGGRSRCPNRMSDDLEAAGIDLSDRTIRKHLRDAEKHLTDKGIETKTPNRLWESYDQG